MNRNLSSISLHNAHFPLKNCIALAEQLRRSGQYGRVNVANRIYFNGEHFAKIFVESKPAADDICEESFWRDM